jgi:hypothetical protein
LRLHNISLVGVQLEQVALGSGTPKQSALETRKQDSDSGWLLLDEAALWGVSTCWVVVNEGVVDAW